MIRNCKIIKTRIFRSNKENKSQPEFQCLNSKRSLLGQNVPFTRSFVPPLLSPPNPTHSSLLHLSTRRNQDLSILSCCWPSRMSRTTLHFFIYLSHPSSSRGSLCVFFVERERDRTEQNRTEQKQNRTENRTEQNRTEQNRTEQNRTEQNRTEQNRTDRTEQNRTETQNRTEQNRTEQNRTEQNRTEQRERQTHRQTDTQTDRHTDRQTHRQTDRLNAKRPACQSNKWTNASRNSLTIDALLRKWWAHVILSRSITNTMKGRSTAKNANDEPQPLFACRSAQMWWRSWKTTCCAQASNLSRRGLKRSRLQFPSKVRSGMWPLSMSKVHTRNLSS